MLFLINSIEARPPSRNRFSCSLRNAPNKIHNAKNRLFTHSGNGMPDSLEYPCVSSTLNSSNRNTEPLFGASFALSFNLASTSGVCCLTSVQKRCHCLPALKLLSLHVQLIDCMYNFDTGISGASSRVVRGRKLQKLLPHVLDRAWSHNLRRHDVIV